jgi:transposase
MTAVEIARARLAHATARRASAGMRATRMRATRTPPRHDDSGAQLALEGVLESALHRDMTTTDNALPDDTGALRALILAERAAHAAAVTEREQLAQRNVILERLNAKLEAIVTELKRAHFGRKSERITDDQLALALDELETAAAKAQAEAEKDDATLKATAARKRRASRNEKLDHLPHEEVVIEPESKTCPCCGGALHVIGEDVSKRLDKVPATVRVLVTRRPKYACRSCEKGGADEVAGIIQAPAPARLIEGGLPTEALVADVVVSKYADHLPLYRQSQILSRHGVRVERATLAQWVGAAAAELQPLTDRLLQQLKASSHLFCDETRCPVLDPGRGKTKTGYLWAIARDERPWGGSDPPTVVYSYAPGRGGAHALRLLDGFKGVLQVDGYAAYNALTDPARPGGTVTLAYCWSHLRRKFYEVYVGGHSPIATEALARIKTLYATEDEIRGLPPELRRRVRQDRSRPVVDALKSWFEQSLAAVPKGGKIGEALAYGLNHWDGLTRFLDDGRIEIDTNTVERSIRGLALNRKNALFAGHDLGAENWATIASLVETCKLNAVDPLAWMTDVLTRLVNLWPASRIDELMPWAYAAERV